jgi:pyridoxine 4-dehydrogenase
VYPIANVEIEMSLFSTDPFTNGVVATCAELNIPLVEYSPLSRGFLTSQLRLFEDLVEDGSRRHMPKFQAEIFEENLRLVEEVQKVARRKGCTVSQVAVGLILGMSGREMDGRMKLPTIIPTLGSDDGEQGERESEAGGVG